MPEPGQHTSSIVGQKASGLRIVLCQCSVLVRSGDCNYFCNRTTFSSLIAVGHLAVTCQKAKRHYRNVLLSIKSVRLTASVALATGFGSNPCKHSINALAIANLASCRLASPVRCEGHDAGPIMRVLITSIKLLEHFLGNIIRFQQ